MTAQRWPNGSTMEAKRSPVTNVCVASRTAACIPPEWVSRTCQPVSWADDAGAWKNASAAIAYL
jgi:hypothetical protein